jgi:hypothetical protein
MKRIARLAAFALALAAAPVSADDHRSDRAGHPLKVVAKVLHPIGVVIDYVIFRPAHWLANREPVKTLTGHEED